MSQPTLKEAFKTLDQVIEEATLAEQTSLEIICTKLQEENSKLHSPVVDKIIGVLKDWSKVPVNEIKERVLKL